MNVTALFTVCVLIWGTTWYAITFQLAGATPEVGYLAIFGSVLAFGAYFALLARIGPAHSVYVGVMSTVVALFVSSIFEAYDWRWLTVLGIALAVFGNVLALNVKPEASSLKPVA